MTKYPFTARINGEEVIVWPDWIERPDGEHLAAIEQPRVSAARVLELKRAVPLFPLRGSRQAAREDDEQEIDIA